MNNTNNGSSSKSNYWNKWKQNTSEEISAISSWRSPVYSDETQTQDLSSSSALQFDSIDSNSSISSKESIYLSYSSHNRPDRSSNKSKSTEMEREVTSLISRNSRSKHTEEKLELELKSSRSKTKKITKNPEEQEVNVNSEAKFLNDLIVLLTNYQKISISRVLDILYDNVKSVLNAFPFLSLENIFNYIKLFTKLTSSVEDDSDSKVEFVLKNFTKSLPCAFRTVYFFKHGIFKISHYLYFLSFYIKLCEINPDFTVFIDSYTFKRSLTTLPEYPDSNESKEFEKLMIVYSRIEQRYIKEMRTVLENSFITTKEFESSALESIFDDVNEDEPLEDVVKFSTKSYGSFGTFPTCLSQAEAGVQYLLEINTITNSKNRSMHGRENIFISCVDIYKQWMWSQIKHEMKFLLKRITVPNSTNYKAPPFATLKFTKSVALHFGDSYPTLKVELCEYNYLKLINGGGIVLFKKDVYTPENFRKKEFIIGTILNIKQDAHSNHNMRSNPLNIHVNITIHPDYIGLLDFSTNYYTLEYSEYFSEYEHSLSSLDEKNLCFSSSAVSGPLSDLLNLQKVKPTLPDYLYDFKLDLAPIFAGFNSIYYNIVNGLPDFEFSNEQGNLVVNESQYKSICNILTKDVSLTLGGPGTGKSFIATKALQIIHKHMKSREFREPVIFVCRNRSTLYKIMKSIRGTLKDAVFADSNIHDIPDDLNDCHIDTIANRLWTHDEKFKYGQLKKDRDMFLLDWNRLVGYFELLNDNCGVAKLFAFLLPDSILHTFKESWKLLSNKGKVRDSLLHEVLVWADATYYEYPKIPDSVFDDLSDIYHPIKEKIWSKMHNDPWYMSSNSISSILSSFSTLVKDYLNEQLKDLQSALWKMHKEIDKIKMALWGRTSRFASVLGLTLSAVLEFNSLLREICPKVMLVLDVEAFNDIELLTTVSSPSLEHLALFADPYILSTVPDSPTSPTYKMKTLISMIEASNNSVGFLNEQYRMSLDITNLLASVNPSYNNQIIKSNAPRSSYGFKNTTLLVDVPYCNYTTTYFNHIEAEIISRMVVFILQQGYDPSDIAIITFTEKQVSLVRHHITSIIDKYPPWDSCFNLPEIEMIAMMSVKYISTGPRKFTLLSTVSNVLHELTNDMFTYHSVISALSMATETCYIISHLPTLRVAKAWRPIINFLEAKGCVSSNITLNCSKHVDTKIDVCNLMQMDLYLKHGGCKYSCLQRLDCGHSCPFTCHPWSHSLVKCKKPCGKVRSDHCDHPCTNQCSSCQIDGCPPCNQVVEERLSCGHLFSVLCSKRDKQRDSTLCELTVEFKLPKCYHIATLKCHLTRDSTYLLSEYKCSVIIEKRLKCGHRLLTECGASSDSTCTEVCNQRFDCGHVCNKPCASNHLHERINCEQDCFKKLVCGHNCSNGCGLPNRHTLYCRLNCSMRCSHGFFCSRACHRPCQGCIEPCPNVCPHYKCTKTCQEPCDRPPCNERCTKKLECGHACAGLCGEICPPCNKCIDLGNCPITLGSFKALENNEAIYILPDCSCVFYASGLDSYFTSGDNKTLKLWDCPKCQKHIFMAFRYQRFIKEKLKLFNDMKLKMEFSRSVLSEVEKDAIITAMASEVNLNVYDTVGGRWFACPNNHPYYIGECGGATETSQCPECKEEIGGGKHRILESNRFYGEFDNSLQPAWPNQP